MARILLFASCAFSSIHGQMPQPPPSEQAKTKPLLAFSVVSVKPAPPGTYQSVPQFMRDRNSRILGVQRMAAPVNMLIGYAYHMQISEALDAFRKQPEWTRKKIYTVNFRADGEPTREQMREMMRTMLADRFGLEIHDFTREGMVNKLVMNKAGVLGPNLKPHPAEASCTTQVESSVGNAPDASAPPARHCGFVWYYLPGNVLHIEITDTTIAAAGVSLAGIGPNGLETHPVIDATGLTGKYDLTLEFRPASFGLPSDPDADDDGAPSFFRALKDQLGVRVESGQGPVRMIVIDHISVPTPD